MVHCLAVSSVEGAVGDILSSQATSIQRQLCARRADGLFAEDIAGEFVIPAYDGRSLVNIPATLALLLGQRVEGMAAPLEPVYWRGLRLGARRIVLVLLDALGHLQLHDVLQERPDCLWGRMAQRGRLLPMTSVCPSTTAAALATLATGRAPIAHGLLGYELWLREYGVLSEMLGAKPVYGTGKETLLDWGLVPETFLPLPSLGTRLGQAGIRTTAVIRDKFVRGVLTRMCYRGFDRILGHTNDATDLWDVALRALRNSPWGADEPELLFVYWGGIDKVVHKKGAVDPAWRQALREVTDACEQRFLNLLEPREREGTLFLMIADHGFVDTPSELAHDVETDPVLRERLMIPHSGESRFAYLHLLDPDRCESVVAIRRALGPDYVVCQSEEAIRAGLFGDASEAMSEARARLGHLCVIARDRHYLDRQEKRLKMRGRHGGLTPEEMLVPWLAVRLDD